MRVLITGGSGQIGPRLAAALTNNGHQVTLLDTKPADAPGITQLTADIRSLDEVSAAAKGMDALVHLAAIADHYEGREMEIYEINTMGTCNVMEAALRHKIKRVVFASSLVSYGLIYSTAPFVPQYLPIDPDHPSVPDDSYGASKLMGEKVAQAYAKRHDMDVIALRLNTLIFPDKPKSVAIHQERLANPDKHAHRLWGYVMWQDAIQAFCLAVQQEVKGFHVLNVSAADAQIPTETTIELIRRHYPDLKELRTSSGFLKNPHATCVDITRTREVLGWEPKLTWRDAPELAGPYL